MKRYVLNEMIWPEVAAELENFKVGIVPVGSCEQHGYNTTFETDTARCYEVAKLLSERLGNKALIFAPVTYSISAEHMDFPGSVTLRVETFINMLTDIAISITKHGIKKVVFLNGHGGNNGTLDAVVIKLKYEYDIDAYSVKVGCGYGPEAVRLSEKYGYDRADAGHASETETSCAMYVCPWIVRDDRVKGEMRQNDRLLTRLISTGYFPVNWKEHVSANGAMGDATKASFELGKEIIELDLVALTKVINEIIEL